MIAEQFKTARLDGRSDRQVIIDLCAEAPPQTMYTYQMLGDALQRGVESPIVRQRIQQAVRAARKDLLRRHQRWLMPVANVGYKVAHGKEHLPLSLDRKKRGERVMVESHDLVFNAPLDQLSPVERKLVEGQQLLMGSLLHSIRESNKRHQRSEQAIDDLKKRVDDLERNKP